MGDEVSRANEHGLTRDAASDDTDFGGESGCDACSYQRNKKEREWMRREMER